MTFHGSMDNMLRRRGQKFTLRHEAVSPGPNSWTQGATVTSYAVGYGRERMMRSDPLEGSVRDTESLVILAGNFPVTPKEGDRISAGTHSAADDATTPWKQITHVYPAIRGEKVGVYRVNVEG